MVGTTYYHKEFGKEFSEEAMKHRLCLAPGKPRFIAMRVADEEDNLPIKEHAIYISGVGTLLYLTKHTDLIFAMQ